jgi:hypothetical protein
MIRILSAGAAEPAAAVPAAAEPPAAPPRGALLISYGVAVGGFVAGNALSLILKPGAFTPLDGFSALALFYIAAQAIERAIEPFTGLVKVAPEAGQPAASKTEAESHRAVSLAAAYAAAPEETQGFVNTAARWQRVIDEIRANTTLYAWGFATALGALASGMLGLYLMKAVGAGAVPNWLDIIATGLIVGGGSKALHDVIKSIEKSKEDAEDPPEAA